MEFVEREEVLHTLRQRLAEAASAGHIAQLLCKGLRNGEIAQQLRRSVRTVDHHLAAIFAKLDVASRADAVATARGGGLAATP